MGEPELKSLVTEKLRAVEKKDYYELLGVTKGSSKPEVQKAYFELAKKLHPDRLAKFDLGPVKDDASRLFKELSDAYNTLMDPRRRGKYEKENPGSGEVRAPSSTSTQELLQKAAEPQIGDKEAAKIFCHKGMMLMRKGAFADAETLLGRACEADEENARYALQLGWAIFQNPAREKTKRLLEARKHLERAVTEDAENPEAHYFMARYWKEAGQPDQSRTHLEKALKFRENYIEAKRELRLLDMRSRKPGGSRSASSSAKGKGQGQGKGKGKTRVGKGESEGRWPFGLDKLFKRKK